MTRILILRTGNTAPEVQSSHGDYDRWFIDAMPRAGLSFEVHDATRGALPSLEGADGAIVTGSVSSVCRPEPWMAALSEQLREADSREVPILGVCFGAQILARARGGQVVLNPQGWEIGSVRVRLTDEGLDDPLFAGLPREFGAMATHEDRIEQLPANGVLLAGNDSSPVQAFRAGRSLWGVQFHPEASAAIIEKLIQLRVDALTRDASRRGLPTDGHTDRLLDTLKLPEAGQGGRVLENFLRICRAR